MKISNKKRRMAFAIQAIIVFLLVVFGVVGYVVSKDAHFNALGVSKEWLLIFPFLVLILYTLAGRPIFEYDGDGEALNFKNQLVLPLIRKSASDEFPKYKFLDFEIVNLFIVKRLYVKISSKRKSHITLRYDISYLSNKEICDLRSSLKEVANSKGKNLNELK